MTSKPGKKMPYSEEAEKGVLGAMMIDSVRVMNMFREAKMNAGDFFMPAHKEIYKAIEETESKNSAGVIDILTVGETIRCKDLVSKCGGDKYLHQLADACTTVSHVPGYLEILQEKSKRRRLIFTSMEAMGRAYDEEDDISDAFEVTQSKLMRESERDATATTNADAILECYDEFKDAAEGNVRGLPCFIRSINNLLGNFRYGKPHLIAAPPGKGKTTMLCNQFKAWSTGLNATRKQIPCAIASLEMSHAELMGNIIAEHADVSAFSLKTGYGQGNMPKERLDKFMDAAKRFVHEEKLYNKVPLYINDRYMNIDQICGWARYMVWKHDIKALGVDFLQLVKERKGFRGSSKEEVDSVMEKFVKLGKDTGLAIIILSQLTLAARREARKPTFSDMKGSGSISEYTYSAMLIHEWEDQFYAKIDKNRGGLTGEVPISFQGNRQRFTAYVEPEEQEDNDDGIAEEQTEWYNESE